MFKLPKFLTTLAIAASFLPVFPVHGADFELVGRELTRMLQNGHYARMPFNEDLSARFLERYLNSLDPSKLYFVESEVAEFERQYGRSLHDRISTKTIMPVAKSIYEIYQGRVTARVGYVKYLLESGEFEFEDEREVMADRSDAAWPKTGLALQTLWRENAEELVLSEMVRRERLKARAKELGKPDPFREKPSARKTVELKFDRLFKSVSEATEEDIANSFFSAVTKSYDPHSEYFSASEMAKFKIDVSNELVGIGASLETNDKGEIEIKGIVNGGPADKQGDLELGDRIIAISPEADGEWKSVLFKSIDKVIEDILGEEEELVGLKVRREVEGEDEVVEITIPRGVVTIKDELTSVRVFEYGEEEDRTRFAVMTIPSFYFDFDDSGSRVSVDVERLLGRLEDEKIDGLALDLRNNTGGSLPEVQRLTGLFVGKGPVVQVRSLSGEIRSLKSLHRKPIYDGPLVVLTNKNSASATEILAGALQDYHRAVVIGASSTYGKGTVQKTMDISDYMPILADRDRAGWLKLTFQKYYRVSGSSVQIRGVTPDLILPDLSDAYERGEGQKKYALPHDVIRRSSGFQAGDRSLLFIPELALRSEKRVADEPYFKYLKTDIERARKQREKNTISLHLKTRLAELEELEGLREERSEERKKRFAQIEKEDEMEFRMYRLTLDDLWTHPLPPFDPKLAGDDYIRRASSEIEDLEDDLNWPSGIDPVKREGLHVLRDLVTATREKAVAQAEVEEGEGDE